MPTQTVISINRQTPIMGPATFYPRVVVERLPKGRHQRAHWCKQVGESPEIRRQSERLLADFENRTKKRKRVSSGVFGPS